MDVDNIERLFAVIGIAGYFKARPEAREEFMQVLDALEDMDDD